MCIALDTMLADKQTHDAREAFAGVFSQLLMARALRTNPTNTPCQVSQNLTEQLHQLSQSYREQLNTLPKHKSYSRNIIGTHDNWIGLICRWEPNVTSSIHGHPPFAYYHVMDGEVAMDMYEAVNDSEARQVSTSELCTGDSIFSIQKKAQFDNLIHRVRTANSTVFTLHLYSDNPAKGRVFKAV